MARIGLPDTYKGEGVLIIVANLLLIGSIASGNGFLIGISAAFFYCVDASQQEGESWAHFSEALT